MDIDFSEVQLDPPTTIKIIRTALRAQHCRQTIQSGLIPPLTLMPAGLTINASAFLKSPPGLFALIKVDKGSASSAAIGDEALS